VRACLIAGNVLQKYSVGVKGVSPTWVRGDFDGDRLKDYAVILSDKAKGPRKLAAIAFCRGASSTSEIFGPQNIADVDKRDDPFSFSIGEWRVARDETGTKDEIHMIIVFGASREKSESGTESGEALSVFWTNREGFVGVIFGG
jgi:hypothetical protein